MLLSEDSVSSCRTGRWGGVGWWCAACILLACLAATDPAAASTLPAPGVVQQAPGPPVQELALHDGGTLLVAPDATAAAAAVTFVFPGGAAADPEGGGGTSSLVAALMAGARTDQGDSIATRIQALGGDFTVAAGADALMLAVRDTAGALAELVELLARAAFDPVSGGGDPSADALTRVQAERIRAAQRARAQPDALARRALLRSVYGDHAYGRIETARSVAAVTPADIAAYGRTWIRPANVLAVAAGPVEPDRVREWVDAAFAQAAGGAAGGRADPADPAVPGQPGGTGPLVWPRYGPAPDPGPTRIVLVHVPDAPEAVVHMGHLLPEGAHPDWPTLEVLNLILGGGVDGWLFRVEADGGVAVAPGGQIVTGAVSSVQRRRDRGLLQVRASVLPEALAGTLRGLRDGLAEARRRFPSPSDLGRSRDSLAAAFAARAAGAEAFAALLASQRLVGAPDSALRTYAPRVGRLGPQDIRDAAIEHLRPENVSVALVGDATLLLDSARAVAPVDVVDPDGRPVDPDTLPPPPGPPPVVAEALHPLKLEYRVSLAGQQIGQAIRALEHAGAAGPADEPEGRAPLPAGAFTFRSAATLGAQEIGQTVTFVVDDGSERAAREEAAPDARTALRLRPLAATATLTSDAERYVMELQVDGRSVTGSIGAPEGTRRIVATLPDDAVMADLVEMAVWAAPIEAGASWRLPVLDAQSGALTTVAIRVGPRETMEVPAGAFEVHPVTITGQGGQTLWVRARPPHVPVVIEPAGQPVRLELVRLDEPGALDPG